MYRREPVTIKVELEGDESLIFECALENYPDAVHLEVFHDLRRWRWYNGESRELGWIADSANFYTARNECDPPYESLGDPNITIDDGYGVSGIHISYYAIVKVDYYQAGLHLETAPDEWCQVHTDYALYGSLVLLHKFKSHVPNFNT